MFSSEFKKIIDKKVGKGKKFKNYRDFAKFAGISAAVLSHYVRGRSTDPSLHVLGKISIALGRKRSFLAKLFYQDQS